MAADTVRELAERILGIAFTRPGIRDIQEATALISAHVTREVNALSGELEDCRKAHFQTIKQFTGIGDQVPVCGKCGKPSPNGDPCETCRQVNAARLDEAKDWRPVECFQVAHRPLRSPLCSACQRMARWEERIAALENGEKS